MPLASVNISSCCWLLFRCYLSSLCSLILFSVWQRDRKWVLGNITRLNLENGMLACRQTVLETVVPSSVRLRHESMFLDGCWFLFIDQVRKERSPSPSLTEYCWSVLEPGAELLTAPVEPRNGQLLYRAASKCDCTYFCNSNPPQVNTVNMFKICL